jgi:hypothetical protein
MKDSIICIDVPAVDPWNKLSKGRPLEVSYFLLTTPWPQGLDGPSRSLAAMQNRNGLFMAAGKSRCWHVHFFAHNPDASSARTEYDCQTERR